MENIKILTEDFIKSTWREDKIVDLFEVVTEDFIYSSSLTENKDFNWFANYVKLVKSNFTDVEIEFLKTLADEESSISYYKVHANHTGSILGEEPTGKRIVFEAFTMLEFEGNQIKLMNSIFDVFELRKKLNA